MDRLDEEQISSSSNMAFCHSFTFDSGTWKFLMDSRDKSLQYTHYNLNSGSWKWTGNSKGEFTFQNCWDLIRDKSPEWPFYSISWFPKHCHNMSVCLIRALHGKLLTKYFLKNHGIIQEEERVLCQQSTETVDHLYF